MPCPCKEIMDYNGNLFNQKHIYYIGDFIYISRRNLELLRALAGIMLITYVSGMILALELGAKSVLDVDTVRAVQLTLDVPAFLAMIIFSGLSIRLELFKPKYKLPVKKWPLYNGMLIVAGIVITASMLYLKYV